MISGSETFRSTTRPRRPSLWLTCCLLLAIVGCDNQPTKKSNDDSAAPAKSGTAALVDLAQLRKTPFAAAPLADTESLRIEQILNCEERILDLSPFISRVGKFLAGEMTDRDEVQKIFIDDVSYVPLDQANVDELFQKDAATDHAGHRAIGHAHWPLQQMSEVSKSDFLDQLWKPLRDKHKFSDSQFGVESGRFDDSGRRFEMEFLFEGRLSHSSGEPKTGVKAKQKVEWVQADDGIWYVGRWEQVSFDLVRASSPLFEDVTAAAIADPQTLKTAQRATHQELMEQRIEKGNIMWPVNEDFPYFDDWESGYQYPAVSVVDFDSDGDDDLFLTDRGLPGMMLRNDAGKFVDVTAEIGLEVPPMTNCTFFADFDNDGDPDLLAGRSLADSMYFINDNGKFRHDTETDSELEYVRFVVSGCVLDINNDGLLDVYLSTYVSIGDASVMSWITKSIRPKDRLRVKLAGKKHPYVDRGGPANILLMNQGGKLKRVEVGDELAQWRNTYQSTSADWDGDGDQDLYLCNDFSPDVFLRNDTPQGSMEPKFSPVSETIVENGEMGFGMGSSWGDYDSDGDLDLYVSNMYSKAGRRIIKLAGEVDARSVAASRGNFLFQNNGGKFRQVAGFEDDDQHVAKVGWSFGGQFADFDNDTQLDLYVPSGFFTAPKKVRSDEDL